MSDTPTTPAGWYDDGSGQRRYWDGAAWTEYVEPPATPAETTPTDAPSSDPAPDATATQAYGSGSTDAYGTAPTRAYGSETPDTPGAAPTQSYGSAPAPSGAAQAPYGSAPYGSAPYGSGAAQAPYGAPTQQYGGPTQQYGAPIQQYGAPTQQYGAPTGYAPPRAPQPADAKPGIVGLIALGVAVIGFLLACIPVAVIGAYVLLPIALVLAIVAFFLRGKKWPAIVALILSVVGGIVAIVVSFVLAFILAGQVISELPDLPDTDSTVAPPTETSDGGQASPSEAPGDGEVGSRENPAPIGSTITGDDYTVVIDSVTLNADDQITAAGYPPADDGLSYVLIGATLTYTGSDESGSGLFVSISYVAPDDTTYSFGDNDAFPPDPDINYADLPAGQPVTGNTVLAIPVAADGVLAVSPGLLGDTVYVALR